MKSKVTEIYQKIRQLEFYVSLLRVV